MENKSNIISSEAKLSAIAGVMFFAPFVKNRIETDPSFSEEEKAFIAGYVKIGFINLVFLVIVLIAAGLNLLWINGFLSRIITIGSFVIYIISVFSIFACANELPMRGENEPIKQEVQHKGQILKVYAPIVNFVLRFRQENYNIPYRWIKESILLRTFFIFGTLLLGNSFGMGVLIIIAVRVVLLMLNIDIVPLSMKKTINALFLCNPGEIFAYIFAPIVSKIKKSDYETILQARKQGYMQGQNFGIGIIIQYVIFIGILFLLYRGINISLENIILFIAIVLRIIRNVVFYVKKKALLKIPILSEIISIIFN